MKPDFNITSEIPDNAAEFNSPFYNRFTLRKNTQPLQLSNLVSKDFQFPSFYQNVSCGIGIFMCSYAEAQNVLPHPSMKPVKMPSGRAVVIFSCYEYRNVMNMKPYNEIAMTIPLLMDPTFSIPVLPLVSKAFKNFGYHVFSMPVTSEENRLRGTKLWGIPKVTERIDIEQKDGFSTTVAFDENEKEYFRLKIPMQGKPESFDETGHLYSIRKGEIIKAQTNFMGDFKVNKNMGLLFNKGKESADPLLTLGDSPRAEILKRLEIEESVFQTRWCPSMEASFDLGSVYSKG
ncbi:MAG: acetoacetate decarboxylase family protein [Flavobacteriales bacterium]|nr:acetoacetate decarboxylase family protein [Flavobacteriales bacterium]